MTFFFTQTRFRPKKPDWLDPNHDLPILPRLPHPPPNHFKLYAHILTHQSIPPSSLPKSLELNTFAQLNHISAQPKTKQHRSVSLSLSLSDSKSKEWVFLSCECHSFYYKFILHVCECVFDCLILIVCIIIIFFLYNVICVNCDVCVYSINIV